MIFGPSDPWVQAFALSRLPDETVPWSLKIWYTVGRDRAILKKQRRDMKPTLSQASFCLSYIALFVVHPEGDHSYKHSLNFASGHVRLDGSVDRLPAQRAVLQRGRALDAAD